MKRAYFQDEDGGYYRNCPLIMDELKTARRTGRILLAKNLHDEWRECFREGTLHTDELPKNGYVATMRPFREAYPNDPILWTLDER